MDVAAVERQPRHLSEEEEAEVERHRTKLDRETCRICDERCQTVCDAGMQISWMIHHDVLYEHYRNLGLEAFLEYPLTSWARTGVESHFARRLALVQACTRCRRCEEQCPYHLPILERLQQMQRDHPPLIEAVRARGWSTQDEDAALPPWMDPR
jgi:predicted aldo/keto reductase-like oxidoreductase